MEAERQKWDREYQEKGIPSSFRNTPSSALLWALQAINFDPKDKAILDVGCGAGRNSLYFADQGACVTGFDLSDIAIQQAKQKLSQSGQIRPVSFSQSSLTDTWPVADHSQDMVIDCYVGFHVGKESDRLQLHQSAASALKPDGLFVRAVCAYDDGYYAGLTLDHAINERAKVVLDDITGVPVVLYDVNLLLDEASSYFDLVAFYNEHQPSLMYGKEYPRSNYVAVFRKKKI